MTRNLPTVVFLRLQRYLFLCGTVTYWRDMFSSSDTHTVQGSGAKAQPSQPTSWLAAASAAALPIIMHSTAGWEFLPYNEVQLM